MTNPALRVAAVIAAAIFLTTAQTRDNSLTGNDILSLAGNGDTLWMITTKGFNYTLVPRDTGRSFEWHGFRNAEWHPEQPVLSFGAHRAMVGLPPNARRELGIWHYDHTTDRATVFRLPWNSASIAKIAETSGFSSWIRAADYGRGSFWLACGDGGLVRIDTSALRAPTPQWSVFRPGESHRGFTVGAFPPDTLSGFPDSSRSVEAIAATDSGPVFVATPSAIWRFSPGDTLWEKLPSTIDSAGGKAGLFRGVYVRDNGRWPIYSFVSASPREPASRLGRLDSAAAWWRVYLDKEVGALGFGPSDTLFLILQNRLFAFRESSPPAEAVTWDAFKARMERAAENQSAGIPNILRDVLYVPRGDGADGSLWLATDNGLFFSRDEIRSQIDALPFQWIRRPLSVGRGLKETYAYPSIITPDWRSATIAYCLEKAGNVTISVYDWNMDFVATIVANAFRKAGDQTPEGRSTLPEDSWNATDRRGRPVAPGVYYYRITSTSGGQGFGKIVVAR